MEGKIFDLNILELPEILKERIVCRSPPQELSGSTSTSKKACIIYFPTVVLRHRHNPAFSLACRLANHFQVPLVVWCTVLDDTHLSQKPIQQGGICMTARRLTFYLQALQSTCPDWENHGAGVAIRVHGPTGGARTPHHLTLAHQNAVAVVTDEAFVEPFSVYNRTIFNACQKSGVPCWSVDGSTTVPPCCILQPVAPLQSTDGTSPSVQYTGLPNKAWKWEQKTNSKRQNHVHGAVRRGELDAPTLQHTLPKDFLFGQNSVTSKLPPKLTERVTPCPGMRPWSVSELTSMTNIAVWVLTWTGTDSTVPPCVQTDGSLQAATRRWNAFLPQIVHYAKRRNQIIMPHAVSRMSCYWNLGIISIFDVVHEVWTFRARHASSKVACDKFLQELIKWREMSYAHCFALPQSYHRQESAVPVWALRYLAKPTTSSSKNTFERLDTATTTDETWNAMQKYLIETGELHNNVRMTWGKTALHWLASSRDPSILWQLCCLNDRYALDGLSPPSYAGLLWCFGWCDKPANDGSISTKWARSYRTGPDGFERAKHALLSGSDSPARSNIPTSSSNARKKARISDTTLGSKTLFSYFKPIEASKV